MNRIYQRKTYMPRRLMIGAALTGSLLPLLASAQTQLDGQSDVQTNIDYVDVHSGTATASARKATVASSAASTTYRYLGGQVQAAGAPLAWSGLVFYAAGNNYAQASVIGLGYSDNSGNLHAAYRCPTSGTQVYVAAFGGNAGGGYNTAVGLSAALGACGSVPAAIVVNEVTTVASVYALNRFLDASGAKPGAPASNATGLANAVGTVANLADIGSGLAQTALVAGAYGTPPTATLNQLANVLAPCATAAAASAPACASLFTAATPAGAAAPTTTLQAALNIARNPGANVATLYGLATASPYQPALPAAPQDWTLGINLYIGGPALDPDNNGPAGLAVDAAGNVWVANAYSDFTVNNGNGSLIRLSPQGQQSVPYTDNGGIYAPAGVAIDTLGHVFVANRRSDGSVNSGRGSVSALDASGASLSGSPYASGGLSNPSLLAVDGAGNLVAQNGTSITRLTAAAGYAGTNYPVAGSASLLPQLTALALDDAGNIYLGDATNNYLDVLDASNPAQQLAGSPYTGGGLTQPKGLALDAQGNVWSANGPTQGASNGATEFVKTASGYTASNVAVAALYSPGSIDPVALDSGNTVWVASADAGSHRGVVAISGGSSVLYTAGGLLSATPQSAAIDAAGNVWLSGGAGGNVVEVIGLAQPVKTPLIGLPRLP